MQIEYLSDHAGDLYRAARDRQRRATEELQRAVAEQTEANASHRAARRAKPLWKRFLRIPSTEEREAGQRLHAALLRRKEAEALRLEAHHAVEQHAAGVQGEDVLVTALSSALSDDWLMFCGYRNRRGEADGVVVGPPGVWVIEVKNRNARLFVDGDRWWYEKTDRWGNVVERDEATDGGRRNWGRQPADVADSLVWWLDHNDMQVPVRTALMLLHERASIGAVRDPGVDVVSTDLRELIRAMTASEPVVSRGARTSIHRLIRRDHRHHNPPEGNRN